MGTLCNAIPSGIPVFGSPVNPTRCDRCTREETASGVEGGVGSLAHGRSKDLPVSGNCWTSAFGVASERNKCPADSLPCVSKPKRALSPVLALMTSMALCGSCESTTRSGRIASVDDSLSPCLALSTAEIMRSPARRASCFATCAQVEPPPLSHARALRFLVNTLV
jgi:hypothetical protein